MTNETAIFNEEYLMPGLRRPFSCTPTLDARGQFDPASAESGAKTVGMYRTSVRWRIPRERGAAGGMLLRVPTSQCS